MSPAERRYPPEWCKIDTMAYLLDMSESGFRSLVDRGLLPEGVKIGGNRLWHRDSVTETLARLMPDGAELEPDDPIMRGIRDGANEKARDNAASRRS